MTALAPWERRYYDAMEAADEARFKVYLAAFLIACVLIAWVLA